MITGCLVHNYEFKAIKRIARFLHNIRGVRFLLAGAANSIFGLLAFSLVILLGGSSWVAVLFGQAAGVIFNFWTYGSFVFRNLLLSRLPIFILVYFILYLINLGALNFFVNLVSISPIYLQTILTIPLACVSYILMSKLVFRKK